MRKHISPISPINYFIKTCGKT